MAGCPDKARLRALASRASSDRLTHRDVCLSSSPFFSCLSPLDHGTLPTPIKLPATRGDCPPATSSAPFPPAGLPWSSLCRSASRPCCDPLLYPHRNGIGSEQAPAGAQRAHTARADQDGPGKWPMCRLRRPQPRYAVFIPCVSHVSSLTVLLRMG